MKHLIAVVILVLGLAAHSKAQRGTCSNRNPGDNCFFDGVATLPPSRSSVNEFFVIGGLFDVQSKGTDAYTCGDEISDKSILNLLAFFWSVNFYGQAIANNGVSVGAFAFDNCFRTDQTVENLLGFSQCKLFLRGIRENVVAYVGPYSNDDSLRAGMVASDLSLTVVSPDANSYNFDAQDHRSVLRIRPNFDNDLRAMLEFIRLVNAEHVVVVYCNVPLYTAAYASLMSMVESSGLCVNRALMVDMNIDDAGMERFVAENLEDQREVKYIIPLMCPFQVARLMRYVARNVETFDRFIYIVNSDVGRNRDIVTDKVVVVEPALDVSLLEFDAALRNIQTNATLNGNFGITSLSNPWLSRYLAQPGVTQVPLVSDNSLPSTISLSVSRTIKATKGIIEGLNNAMTDCSTANSANYQLCDSLRNPITARDIISNAISQSSKLVDSQPMPADINYDYYVYSNSEGDYFKIGDYDAEARVGVLNVPTQIQGWYNTHFTPSSCPDPAGCCVEPTSPPTVPATTDTPQTTPGPTQAPSDIVEVLYPRGQEITGAYALGASVSRDYETRFDDGHSWVIALGVLAGLGLLSVLVFEIYIMYKLIGTRLGNKWRTMWLGQLLLFGVFLGYLTLIAYIFVPTDATCGITRFGVGVSYAICFAVLLVKLMVILTSKSSDVLLPGDGDSPNYLKGVYQFLMFIFAVGVQVVINVQWLIVVPPEAVQVMSRNGEPVWVCNHYTWEAGKNAFAMADFVRTNFENHLLSLVYIMGLILITTILSLRAHGIITNHRESVFIGIAAGFSIPIWLAWGLVGGLNKEHDVAQEFGDACIAFGLFLTLTLILFAMFLPKVRQLVNMGVEGIYLEDDRDTYYAGSVIMAPPSYKSKGPSSVIYVNNQGIYSQPVISGNGDAGATHLRHPGSTYSAPAAFKKKSDSTYGGSRVLRMTDDLKGRHPQKKTQSEVNYGGSTRSRSTYKGGSLRRSRSQSDNLGAL